MKPATTAIQGDGRPHRPPHLCLDNVALDTPVSPVSGMANNDVSVATRNVPWTDIPTPPPITTPSHTDSSACKHRLKKRGKQIKTRGG